MISNKRLQHLSKGASRLAIGVAIGLTFAGGAMAQSQTGALRITISGANGQPLPGATVIVSSPDSLITKTAVTDAEGRVRLSGLDPATNYTVEVESAGYPDFTTDQVAVVSGRDLSLGYALRNDSDATNLEDIVVTGRSLAAIDVTSAQISTTLTLDIVESLPTGRDFKSYLQLVPGVKPSSSNNPSSRSGVNYTDAAGATGASTDNVYYLDGVDVTDPSTGLAGGNINSEIIQEQQVIVSGVPAEFAGGSGLISTVVTKSGSNEFHGSLNYYLQNDDLVAEDKHQTSGGFSTYDTAVTFGGPILRDRLWFFASYQKKYREDEILNPLTGDLLRTVERESEYGFGKLTWQITDNDRLSLSYFNDPETLSGSTNPSVLNNRSISSETGGDNYRAEYSHTWDDLTFTAYYFNHEGESSSISADQSPLNTIIFRNEVPSPTNAQRQLGGGGANSETFRNREEYGATLEYFLDTSFGSHTFKAGYTRTDNEFQRNATVPGNATYTSISTNDSGETFGSFLVANSGWTALPFSSDDRARIVTAIEASSNEAFFTALLDADASGNVTNDEINNIVFNNTAGNPNSMVNAARSLRTIDAPYTVTSEGQAVYLQDTWTLGQLTVDAGVRAEEWSHYGSSGDKLFTFDWELAPRLSVVFDLFGDGRTKVFGFAGRYYDPIRNDMTNFAGNTTGPVTEEQINIGGEWLTYRTRGGSVVLDSVFSPTTKTPYTDEFLIGASTTFRDDIVLQVTATNRQTRDIFEDYDLAVYSNPNATAADGADGIAFEGSPFYIPLSYFGYDTAPTGVNYVLGTLLGGKRDYTGFEVTLQKFKTDNWQGAMSYTYNIATGNTNSDGNADLQGDLLFLDPRAPGVYGDQPGNIEHQFKAFASYAFDFGLEVSGVFNWNSGSLYTPATDLYGRYIAPQEAAYEFGGVTSTWLTPGLVGSEKTPAYYTFDMRFKYQTPVPILGGVELFLDVFNVLDEQSATSEMKLLAGNGVYAYQEANAWVQPRRAYLGVRYSF